MNTEEKQYSVGGSRHTSSEEERNAIFINDDQPMGNNIEQSTITNPYINQIEATNTTVLVTGGLGFVGSHTVVELINLGHKVVIIDNLQKSCTQIMERIVKMTNKEAVDLVIGDMNNFEFLMEVFQKHQPRAVIHCA